MKLLNNNYFFVSLLKHNSVLNSTVFAASVNFNVIEPLMSKLVNKFLSKIFSNFNKKPNDKGDSKYL